jgi:hypothetical protein
VSIKARPTVVKVHGYDPSGNSRSADRTRPPRVVEQALVYRMASSSSQRLVGGCAKPFRLALYGPEVERLSR